MLIAIARSVMMAIGVESCWRVGVREEWDDEKQVLAQRREGAKKTLRKPVALGGFAALREKYFLVEPKSHDSCFREEFFEIILFSNLFSGTIAAHYCPHLYRGALLPSLNEAN
jgi:hypothetical protein